MVFVINTKLFSPATAEEGSKERAINIETATRMLTCTSVQPFLQHYGVLSIIEYG